MSIPINEWVNKQKFTYYYIMPKPPALDLIGEYEEIKQWLNSSTITGKWDMRTVRIDENTLTIGGMNYLYRCIILFEREGDRNWFSLRWSWKEL